MIRLYHYLEACWALDNIRQRRLKLSNLLGVNDPYELASVYSTDPVTQATLEDSRPGISHLEVFNSFSCDWNNILMGATMQKCIMASALDLTSIAKTSAR